MKIASFPRCVYKELGLVLQTCAYVVFCLLDPFTQVDQKESIGVWIYFMYFWVYFALSVYNQWTWVMHTFCTLYHFISKHLGLTTIFDIVECNASPELKQFWPKPALKNFLNHLIITIEKKSCYRDRRKKMMVADYF